METWKNEEAISKAVKKGQEIRGKSAEEADRYFEEAFEQISLHFNEIDRYCVSKLYPALNSAHATARDIFVGVWKGLPKFRFESTWRTWVYGIAKRRIASTLRKIIRDRERFEEGGKTHHERREDPPPTPEASYRYVEQSCFYEYALSQLEMDERAVLILFYTYKRPMPEIAHSLGMSLATSYRRRAGALQKCSGIIKELSKGNLR